MSESADALTARIKLGQEIAANQGNRAELAERHGQVWDKDQLREDFEVLGFGAPLVVVRRKSDKQKGSLEFQPSYPRYYFNFEPHVDS